MTAVILLSESARASIAKDAVTFAFVTGIIGVGVWCGSAAMQWAGFLMLAAAMGRLARVPRLTPQQAADRLWRDYHVRAAECTETAFSGPLAGETGASGGGGAGNELEAPVRRSGAVSERRGEGRTVRPAHCEQRPVNDG